MRVFTRHSIKRRSKYVEHFKVSKYNNKYWCGIFRGRYGIKLVLPEFCFNMLHRAFSYRNRIRRGYMTHQPISYND